MEVPTNLIVIMILSGIVFIGSICSLVYGLRMDSDTSKPKEIIDTTGKFSSYKVGRHVELAPKKKSGFRTVNSFSPKTRKVR